MVQRSGDVSPAGAPGATAALRAHRWRERLAAELHARPPAPVASPARISRLALVTGEATAAAERGHLAALLGRFGVAGPPEDASHFSAEMPRAGWTLVWERHTEFSTYTVRVSGAAAEPFAESALARLPGDWLAGLPGELLVAVELVLLAPEQAAPMAEDLTRVFGGRAPAGSLVSSGRAAVWTDFVLRDDGAVRMLVHDRGLTRGQSGRLVQRLLEIETYRMMALLALPLAREVAPKVTAMERRLAELATSLETLQAIEGERAMLRDLSLLAGEVESLAAETPYRFGAARAYHALVVRRIAELREARIEGLTTIAEFMERRLTPAMRTCESVHERLENLSRRVTRTGDLLRTRVDVTLEQQNLELLASMNRRARLQLRLQQTVEGLSVAAITYYVVGLVGYAAAAGHVLGLPLAKEVVTALAIPITAFAVWRGLRRVRRALGEAGEGR